ncbi:yqaJ domain-containing protein [Trichonephila clavata]|uniref:YqaJ domain-containing protein n=1 Tax=Trichonephila clavata TaxID=2740835 RepID=A0A8X6KFS3_TRICU|nr:yqaJ domain-containing protein [Trichonephila clavata]
MYNTSPGNFVKSIERKRERHIEAKEEDFTTSCRKSLFLDKKSNKNYGVSAQNQICRRALFPKKRMLLSTLRLSDEEMKDIERKTINQRTSPLWKEERRKRLTASDFGAICKKLPHTSCEGIIKKKSFIRISGP